MWSPTLLAKVMLCEHPQPKAQAIGRVQRRQKMLKVGRNKVLFGLNKGCGKFSFPSKMNLS